MSGDKNRVYVDIMATHNEVTGSCILCIVKYKNGETVKFVVDCGLFQEQKYEELNNSLPFKPEELNFVLVTHNHIDHIGRLPFLIKKGFNKNIYSSQATKILMEPALQDSNKVIRNLAKRNNVSPLYNGDDVKKTLSQVIGCNYNEPIEVYPNIKVTFFMNGHLLGAALILVQISSPYEKDINLLFTGDYKKDNIFFKVSDLPNWVLDLPLTVIQESTYGDQNSQEINYCFKNNIFQATQEKKDIVIPFFSLGRSQEIAYILRTMQDSHMLSQNYPIYLDGPLTQKYTEIYLKCDIGIDSAMKDFLPKNLQYINNDNRLDIVSSTKPKIVLTSSGMGSYGPAQTHIPVVIQRKNALIHFTGYMAENTLGRRLKDTAYGETVVVGGLLVKKFADVEYTSEFSAHAKADEMIEFLQKFKNLKLVLINHGEIDTKESFANNVVENVETKNVGILGRDFFFRVSPYGLVKTMGTKFC